MRTFVRAALVCLLVCLAPIDAIASGLLQIEQSAKVEVNGWNWIDTQFQVPQPPSSGNQQNLEFAVELSTGGTAPVYLRAELYWGGSHWYIIARYHDASGTDHYSTPVQVAYGDTILGEIYAYSCPTGSQYASGCQWRIYAADLSASTFTDAYWTISGTLNYAVGLRFDQAVSSCSQYPANGYINASYWERFVPAGSWNTYAAVNDESISDNLTGPGSCPPSELTNFPTYHSFYFYF
jgi:hypothetical protein